MMIDEELVQLWVGRQMWLRQHPRVREGQGLPESLRYLRDMGEQPKPTVESVRWAPLTADESDDVEERMAILLADDPTLTEFDAEVAALCLVWRARHAAAVSTDEVPTP